jgi:hypothetical protein
MGEHLVSGSPIVDCCTHRGHHARRLDTQRHWRRNADIPPALTDDLVPVADAGSPYRDERLVIGEWPRVWKLDIRDGSTDAEDSAAAHHRDFPQARVGARCV